MENSVIPGGNIRSPMGTAAYSRLNKLDPFYEPQYVSRPLRFLQVDLRTPEKAITAIATQASVTGYVDKFRILYSKNEVLWTKYEENGIVKVYMTLCSLHFSRSSLLSASSPNHFLIITTVMIGKFAFTWDCGCTLTLN
jgi:hypothetical protein